MQLANHAGARVDFLHPCSTVTSMSSYYQATSSHPVIALNSGQGIDKEKIKYLLQQMMITAFFRYLIFHILTTVR